jgi:hypothetical protein
MDFFKNISVNKDILESIYKEVEQFGIDVVLKKPFGFQSINQLILFINAEIQEIRDDSKDAIIVAFVKRFYSSEAFSDFKRKIPREIRNKLDGFINEGLVHYISISNGTFVKFNYYMWRRWFIRKITYLYKRLTGFFSEVPRAEVKLCDKCKFPIEPDTINFEESTNMVEDENSMTLVEEEDSTPVVSQMEVFPGQVPESVLEPSPSASPLAKRSSVASKKDVTPSVPQSTQEKI